jgi:hypothetical protein
MKQCAACDSTTTQIHSNGYPQWRDHDGECMCHNCYTRYVWSPILNKKWNPRRLVYKGKTVLLSENPRKGKCKKCGKKIGHGVKITQMHHKEYHDEDVLKDSIELCASCHGKVSQGVLQV